MALYDKMKNLSQEQKDWYDKKISELKDQMYREFVKVEKNTKCLIEIFFLSIINEEYFLGGVYGGNAEKSYFDIIDSNGNHIVHFEMIIDIIRFSELVMNYGHHCNDALICIGDNHHGVLVNNEIHKMSYPNIYKRENGKLGFVSTIRSNALITEQLSNAIENNGIKITKDRITESENATISLALAYNLVKENCKGKCRNKFGFGLPAWSKEND